jgi:hypothetical protein
MILGTDISAAIVPRVSEPASGRAHIMWEHIRTAVRSRGFASVLAVACGALTVPVYGELVTAGLVLRLEANAGVTLASGTNTVTQWANQVTGVPGAPVSLAPTSTARRPNWLAEVEPSGNPALQFLASDADLLRTGSAAAFNSTSLTWMMALRPNSLSGIPTFLQSNLDGRNYAWGTFVETASGNTWFRSEARSDTNIRYQSSINSSVLGGQTLDWMILTSVFDKPAGTLQLFITSADGTRFSGNQVTGAALADFPHARLNIGANTDGNNPADMDLGGVLIYNTALSPAQQLASEQYLFNIYAVPEPSAATLAGIGCLAVAWSLARRGRARSRQA